MALGRSPNPAPVVQAPVTTPTPEPVPAPASAPAATGFDFTDDVTVPGRGNGTNAMENDKEYLALKEKLAAQHEAHKNGTLAKDKGTAFNSPDVKKHVRYLRAAANALNIGVSVKVPDGDANTGRISFRAKDRKQYTKTTATK